MGLRKSIKKTTKLPVSWNDKSAKQLPFLEKRKRVTSLSIFGKEKFDIIDAFFFLYKIGIINVIFCLRNEKEVRSVTSFKIKLIGIY